MGTKRAKKILIHFAKREIDQDTFRAGLVGLLCKWLLSKESEDPLFFGFTSVVKNGFSSL
jgi:hypothetical protein